MPVVKAADADSGQAASAPGLAEASRRDREFVQRLQAGDRAELEQMIAEHQERIARLVHRLSGWSDRAEDLVQDVFVAALGQAHRFDGRSDIGTWLYRIAVNVCRAERRKRSMRSWLWKKWMQRPPELQRAAGDDVEEKDRAASVQDAVRRLPGKYREVIVLRYLEEKEIETVARLLGLSRSAVEVRLHRAREMLKEKLGAFED